MTGSPGPVWALPVLPIPCPARRGGCDRTNVRRRFPCRPSRRERYGGGGPFRSVYTHRGRRKPRPCVEVVRRQAVHPGLPGPSRDAHPKGWPPFAFGEGKTGRATGDGINIPSTSTFQMTKNKNVEKHLKFNKIFQILYLTRLLILVVRHAQEYHRCRCLGHNTFLSSARRKTQSGREGAKLKVQGLITTVVPDNQRNQIQTTFR